MLATMIPISGDPWYTDIRMAVPEFLIRKPVEFTHDWSDEMPSYLHSPPDIIVYKLIATRTLVYQEQL